MVQVPRSPSLAQTAVVAEPVGRPRGRSSILRIILRHPLGVVGGTLIVMMVALAALAPLVAPFDPISQPARRLTPPGGAYLLGTDEFGRDIISRLTFGARVSLQVGVISVSIALLIGGVLGLTSGYFLGAVDVIVQRIVDIMLAFPSVILIVALSGVLGPSLLTAMIAIGIVYAPNFARVARGSTLAVAQDQYVEAARALGAGAPRIIFLHVLPNISATLIVQTTLAFSTAILAEAALSFLGLGTQPPDPSWGTMLGAGRRYMELAPWVAIYPGLAIMLSVLGFNLLGDALRDALDPRLRDA